MANMLDCDIVVSEFEPRSRSLVHFQNNSLRKDKNAKYLQQWIKKYNYCSLSRRGSALNNQWKLIFF